MSRTTVSVMPASLWRIPDMVSSRKLCRIFSTGIIRQKGSTRHLEQELVWHLSNRFRTFTVRYLRLKVCRAREQSSLSGLWKTTHILMLSTMTPKVRLTRMPFRKLNCLWLIPGSWCLWSKTMPTSGNTSSARLERHTGLSRRKTARRVMMPRSAIIPTL